MTDLLSSEIYDAKKIRIDMMGDKLRVLFTLDDKEKAKRCYMDFVKNPYIRRGVDRLAIFYQKDCNNIQ